MEFPAGINRWLITGNSRWPCCPRRTNQRQTHIYTSICGVCTLGQLKSSVLGGNTPYTYGKLTAVFTTYITYYCYHRLYLHSLVSYCIFKLLFSYSATQPQA